MKTTKSITKNIATFERHLNRMIDIAAEMKKIGVPIDDYYLNRLYELSEEMADRSQLVMEAITKWKE